MAGKRQIRSPVSYSNPSPDTVAESAQKGTSDGQLTGWRAASYPGAVPAKKENPADRGGVSSCEGGAKPIRGKNGKFSSRRP
jgi:hypothetical protein